MGYRILFMGTPDFAVPSLSALLSSEHEIVGVITQPDRPKGRGKKLAPPPVKILAQQHHIPCLQPTRIKTKEFESTLRDFRADIFIVVAYGRILPVNILNIPSMGCINVHGSLLPRHRGAAPIQWAIICGDAKAGVSIMQMNAGMDTGDILLTSEVDIAEDETAGHLFEKLAVLGGNTLTGALDKLEQGQLPPTSQDHDRATNAPPLQKDMGNINWGQPAVKLHCLIRGLDPWPCCYSYLKGKRYRFFRPDVVYRNTGALPGTVLLAGDDGIVIATGENCLLIREIQAEGKKRMEARNYLLGHALPIGSVFNRQ